MTLRVTVWVLPNCVQCNQTKREMDKRGIIYEVRELNRNPRAVERFKELGLISAPIVETDKYKWSGFRLERIKSLEHHLKHERALGIGIPAAPLQQIADEVGDE